MLKGERAAARLLAGSGSVVSAYGDPVASAPTLTPQQRAAALAGHPLAVTRPLGPGSQDFRLVARRVQRRGQSQVIVVGQSLRPVQQSVRRVVVLLGLAGPAALLAIAFGGWWLALRALAPIEAMTASAEAIGPERLADRVAEPRAHDEVAHLARTLNTMLDRVQHGVEQ